LILGGHQPLQSGIHGGSILFEKCGEIHQLADWPGI
jgi:hypothetical protein